MPPLKTREELAQWTLKPDFLSQVFRAVCRQEPGQQRDSTLCAGLRDLFAESFAAPPGIVLPALNAPAPAGPDQKNTYFFRGMGSTQNHIGFLVDQLIESQKTLIRTQFRSVLAQVVNIRYVTL